MGLAQLDADAVSLILTHARAHTVAVVVSPVHFIEAEANPDATRRAHVLLMLREIGSESTVDRIQVRKRAEELHKLGIGPADAAHVASAEAVGCDFVTVDDRLLRQLRRINLGVWFGTPPAYSDKENLR